MNCPNLAEYGFGVQYVPDIFNAFVHLTDNLVERSVVKNDVATVGSLVCIKACSKETNIVQQCWANNVAWCWTKILSKFKLKPIFSNISNIIQYIIQHSVQKSCLLFCVSCATKYNYSGDEQDGKKCPEKQSIEYRSYFLPFLLCILDRSLCFNST